MSARAVRSELPLTGHQQVLALLRRALDTLPNTSAGRGFVLDAVRLLESSVRADLATVTA